MANEQAPQPQAMPAKDVFISYASQDKVEADAVVGTLERAGLKCWIAPRDVTPGAHYADEIISAISGARALILVLSDSALTSKHVGKEVERASSKGRPIITLRTSIAPLTPALEYFLSESQWIDIGAGGIASVATKLVEAVRGHCDPAVAGELHGHSGPQVVSRGVTAPRRRWVVAAVVAGTLFACGLVYVMANSMWRSMHAAGTQPSAAMTSLPSPPLPAIPEKSIAVLPFVDMSEKHDQEYFSDGLSEELIDHLAHNTDLKVIARTSSFAFKGKNEDMRTIASKLGVSNLLEGSVRKAGGKLRITAQLIRASDGVHLWSEIYDRRPDDIFKVQDEISTTVAKALNAALNVTPTAGIRSASKGTTNLEAYNLVLQGNYYFWRGNKDDNTKAVEFFQHALALDPHYALGWAKLARVYAWQGFLGELTAAEAEAKGREAAQRALAIDPNCAEAYFARGNLVRFIDGDWHAAISDYEKAIALDPGGEMGSYAHGNILLIKDEMAGRFEVYGDWLRRNLDRNPLDTDQISELALYQQEAGQLEQSAANVRKLLELNPAYAGAQALYGLTLLLQGKHAEALAAAQRESDEASKLQALTCIYWAMSRRADSDEALGALERAFAARNDYMIAAAHAYRGDADSAFVWLDRAYQQRRGSLEGLRTDVLFRKLHDDPRFSAFVRKAKLVE